MDTLEQAAHRLAKMAVEILNLDKMGYIIILCEDDPDSDGFNLEMLTNFEPEDTEVVLETAVENLDQISEAKPNETLGRQN